MMLEMSCDDDHESPLHNWLEVGLKKAEKARSSARPSDRDRLSKEIDSFLQEPNEAEDANPFTWWQVNQLQYPSLAVVARSYLGVPSTSVASERVFSKCGRVCSERRSLLSPEHVEQLVFLSKNISI